MASAELEPRDGELEKAGSKAGVFFEDLFELILFFNDRLSFFIDVKKNRLDPFLIDLSMEVVVGNGLGRDLPIKGVSFELLENGFPFFFLSDKEVVES